MKGLTSPFGKILELSRGLRELMSPLEMVAELKGGEPLDSLLRLPLRGIELLSFFKDVYGGNSLRLLQAALNDQLIADAENWLKDRQESKPSKSHLRRVA